MATSPVSTLREWYLAESARLKQAFEGTGDGIAAIRGRANLVDRAVLQLASEVANAPRMALVALGGYGRRSLFPYSDIDLMFLCANESAKSAFRDSIRRISQDLWDLRLKLSPTTRTLGECDRLDSENMEFTISLLDARFLGGDESLYTRLRQQMLPFLRREWPSLVQLLVERTQTRHERYGRTIFHLEPNIKEAPGGLRDYNVACWMSLLTSIEPAAKWPEQVAVPTLQKPLDFLAATRVFLHYRSGRDDNVLSWESQDQAAARSIGVDSRAGMNAPAWMRLYFRNARAIERIASQLLHEVPARRSSLYQSFQRWRSRVSSPEFSISNGRIYLQNPDDAQNPEVLLRAFEFIAQHGVPLSSDTETRFQNGLPRALEAMPAPESVGKSLAALLTLPHAALALRCMHALGLLNHIIPEFQLIDSLVVRDFYHRYTVDEHTFTAIDNLHRLPSRENQWDKEFAELLQQVENPEVLFLSLLLHDLGKGLPSRQHSKESVELAGGALFRLRFEANAIDSILFLIANHLEMSAAMRRDIFDPENVRAFAAKIGTHERLRLLCLMTYADIRAVNPEALTPWKAENLWRLYVAASNQLNRGLDDDVIHATAENDQVRRLQDLIPNRSRQLQAFLIGLPRRYLLSHTSDQIAVHFDMSLRLSREPAAVALKLGADLYELSVVTSDKPFVFAKIAGALAAWGMNIIKANAFSNASGVVVDSFYFKDRFRTLELNPPERERFKRSIADVVSGKADLQKLLERKRVERAAMGARVAPHITIDNDSSSHSTVMELVAQDRPGLLYQVAEEISEEGFNIELALIDTEGQTAIDVFYVTKNCKKLSTSQAKILQKALIEDLQSS